MTKIIDKKEVLSPEEQVSQILGELKSEILDDYQKTKVDEIEALLQKEEDEKTDEIIKDSLLELNSIQREVNKSKVFRQIDEQIKFFQDIIETSKSKFTDSPEGRQTFRNLRKEAKEKIKELENIKEQLAVVDTKNGSIQQIFLSHQKSLNEIQIDIDNGKFSEASARAVKGEKVNVTGAINNQKDARKEQYNALNMARYNKQLNKIVHDAMVLQIFNDNAEDLRNTMEALRLGTIDRTNPIVLSQIEAMYQLQQQGNLEQYPDIGPLVLNNQNIVNQQKTEKNLGTTKEAFEKKGLMGLLEKGLDQTKMTPKQKEFWKGTSGLLATAGAVFIGWKMISSAWKLATSADERKKGSNWAWLGAPAALTFGANAISGGNISDLWKGGKLTEYMSGWFGGKENETNLPAEEQEFNDTYSKGFLGIGALFSGLTMDKIKSLVKKDENGKIEISEEGYTKLEEAHKEKDDEKSKAALAILANRPKSDKLINLGLEGIFGDYETLENEDDKKEFNELYAEKISRFALISSFLENKKYEISSLNKFGENIKKFISTGKPELSDLEAEGAFLPEKFEISSKESSWEQLKQKKKLMEVNESAKCMIDNKNITITKLEEGKFSLKSANERDIIIYDNGNIEGLNNIDGTPYSGFKVASGLNVYGQLKTANIFNEMKRAFDGKHYKGDKAFVVEEGDIYFNESITEDKINKMKVFDSGIFGWYGTYPTEFKGREDLLAAYLNENLNVSNAGNLETHEVKKLEEIKKDITLKLNDGTNLNFQDGNGFSYDKNTGRLTISGINETNINDDKLISNLKVLIGSLVSREKILGKNTVKQIELNNINLKDPLSVSYLEQLLNLNNVMFGVDFEKNRKMIKYYVDNFDRNKSKVNTTVTLDSIKMEYADMMKTKYEKKLEGIRVDIENILNTGITSGMISFSPNSLQYDEVNKALKIPGLNTNNIQNDQIIKNLENLLNQAPWYNILKKEEVKEILLDNITLGQKDRISVVYLKRLLKLNKNIVLGGDFAKHRDIIDDVAGNFKEGHIQNEYNTNLNMNGIVMLKYIYENNYDFDKILRGEHDSRADFVIKAMDKLDELGKSLDINKDPFQERNMTEKTNIGYGMDYKTKLKVEKNNQDLLNMIK